MRDSRLTFVVGLAAPRQHTHTVRSAHSPCRCRAHIHRFVPSTKRNGRRNQRPQRATPQPFLSGIQKRIPTRHDQVRTLRSLSARETDACCRQGRGGGQGGAEGGIRPYGHSQSANHYSKSCHQPVMWLWIMAEKTVTWAGCICTV